MTGLRYVVAIYEEDRCWGGPEHTAPEFFPSHRPHYE